MTWTVECNSTLRIIFLVFSGATSGQDIREATTEVISLSKEQGILDFLVDATALELTASLVDVIDLPEKQYVAEGLDRRSRVALVEPESPEAKEAAQFYVTACINRGWCVKLFPDHQKAIAWLVAAA